MIYFWIRRQVRKVMKPINQKKADNWSRNLTFIYVMSAWSAFFIMAYNYKSYREQRLKEDPGFAIRERMPGIYYGRVMKAENMHMFELHSGKLTKTGVYRHADDDLLKHSDIDFFGEEVEKENKETN